MSRDRLSQQASTDVDPLEAVLRPLASGKTVQITMDVVGAPRGETKKFAQPVRLVLLTPGLLHGMNNKTVVVSIVGKGCTVIDLRRLDGVANLVLAGMPARLANALIAALRRIFGD